MKSLKVLFFLFFLTSSSALSSVPDKVLLDYVNELQSAIKKNWQPSTREYSYRVIIIFEVDESGNINNLRFTNPNLDEGIKKELVAAIEATKPLAPLPSIQKGKPIEIEFTFDYNVTRNKKYQPVIPHPDLIKSDTALIQKPKPVPLWRMIVDFVLGFILLVSLVLELKSKFGRTNKSEIKNLQSSNNILSTFANKILRPSTSNGKNSNPNYNSGYDPTNV